MAEMDFDPLCAAAERGDAREVRRLLAAGFSADVAGPTGWTALMWAARSGSAECVGRLLPVSDAGARDEDGATALMWAAGRGHALCVELLLPVSNARASSRDGSTALMMAALSGHADCVGRLLPVSDAKARDSGGMTALEHALDGGNSAVSGLLEGWIRSSEERDGLERSLPNARKPKETRKRI